MVFREEKLFGIVVAADGADLAQEPDIAPGQVELVAQEAAAGAGRKEVMVVMPFAGDISGPDLVDGKVFPVEIGPLAAFVLPFAVAFKIEGADAYRPEPGRTEQGKEQSGATQQVKYGPPEGPVQQ
jgi:hypothetical protein